MKSFIAIVFLFLFLTGCGLFKSNKNKHSEKSDVKKEVVKTETADSSGIKKQESGTKTEQKNDITKESNNIRKITNYAKEKDKNGNQLIESIVEEALNEKLTDKSTFTKEEFYKALDSVKTNLQKEFSLKMDSIGKSQSTIKASESNTTAGANIPWWVWLIQVVLVLTLLIFFMPKALKSLKIFKSI